MRDCAHTARSAARPASPNQQSHGCSFSHLAPYECRIQRVSTRVVRSFSIETGEIEYEYTFTYAYDADRPIRLVSVTRDDDVVITPDYTCHEAK